ncbi:predicted protein [Botrytis cinerea T4]|uniref:Uncharacterized protein n=1 Tax=Botryotinia fuckeliana (strain T4) TaxID=999810 RepID=G2Y8C7_BOTF4|nr:predicted protein [Botrytis cinerea T4]
MTMHQQQLTISIDIATDTWDGTEKEARLQGPPVWPARAGQIGQCETKGEALGIAVKAGETPSFRLPQWGQPVF